MYTKKLERRPVSNSHELRAYVRRMLLPAAGLATLAVDAPCVWAQQAAVDDQGGVQEIVVTARRRSESLERVPDSVTALSAQTIENAGIQQVADFVRLTPNMTFRETFREGAAYITIRGITTPQGGWSPVTYVVDGVPAGSVDAINTGALVGIERIEILKGPQSALYGSGAIAGAVNIVTKEPTEQFSGEGKVSYGHFGDERATLMMSGPVMDRVKFRLDGFYRHANGSESDTDGQGVNFNRTVDLRGKLLIDLAPVTIDLRVHYVDTRAGATYQELLPPGAAGLALIDDFDHSPGIQRGIPGSETVRSKEGSVKIEWDAGLATLTSITSYSRLDDALFGTTSWQKPPAAGSFCGPLGGPGEPPDCFQASQDNFKVFTQDLRLTSRADQSLRWLMGASYVHREAPNGLLVGAATAGAAGGLVPGPDPFVNSTFLRHDNFSGVYGQVNYDITRALEATVALRWDENRYNSTQYTSLDFTTPVPTPDGLITQRHTDPAIQPKFQLAYRWSDDIMTYATAAKGFRSGFFYSGNFTRAEHTWNYELGLKSTLLDRLLVLNAAAFHINYSNQQFTTIVPTPPYRNTSNIPDTRINGTEVELTARPLNSLTLGAGLGFTDAKVNDGTADPFTPRFTVNLSAQHSVPLSAGWDLTSRLDYRYQDAQFLGRGNLYEIGPKSFVNLRLGVGNGHWKVTAYGENLSNARQANQFDNVGFGYLRYNSNPRTYGGEVSYEF